MKHYLTVQTNEGNPPSLAFCEDKDTAITTLLKSIIHMAYSGDSLHLYYVEEDGEIQTLGEVYNSDSEFYIPKTSDTWYIPRNALRGALKLETVEDEGERTLKEFIVGAFS